MPISLVVHKAHVTGNQGKYALYTPKSDFGVWLQSVPWPFLLVKLQSVNKPLSKLPSLVDHVWLLLQGGSLLRMMNLAHTMEDKTGVKPPPQPTAVLLLIYNTRDWTNNSTLLMFAHGKDVSSQCSHYYQSKLTSSTDPLP